MALSRWLSRANRQGGVVISRVEVIPNGITGVYAELDLQNNNDFSNPNQLITAKIDVSRDGGNTWDTFAVVAWQGGPPPGRFGKWAVAWGVSPDLWGQTVRLYLEQAGTIRYGILGELTTD